MAGRTDRPSHVGIDTIRLSGQVSGTDWVASLGTKITDTSTVDAVTGEIERWSSWVSGGLLPFNLELSGEVTILVVECSLPRRRNGSNLVALTAQEAQDEVLSLYCHFDLYARWRCPVEDLRVRRLDATVDFTEVTDLPRLLQALASVSAPAERRNPGVFYDRQRGGALTMCRGSREYERSLVYDKHEEVMHRHRKAASVGKPRLMWEAAGSVGVARFETQARSKYLIRQGVRTVADLTQGAVDDLAKRAWIRHVLGTHVADVPTVLSALKRSGLSPAKQSGVLRHLLFERHGLNCDMSAVSCNLHRKEIKQLGLVVDEVDGRRPETWLDFDTRRQLGRATEN